jgi:hypothetical protein
LRDYTKRKKRDYSLRLMILASANLHSSRLWEVNTCVFMGVVAGHAVWALLFEVDGMTCGYWRRERVVEKGLEIGDVGIRGR